VTTEHLDRLWLDQLRNEFANICFQYRVNLTTPILELSSAEKQFGCWLPDQRTIRISRSLIRQYPWDKVLMVFKHEMAHQLCTELFGLFREKHGQRFQQACQLLGVPAPYNLSQGDMPDILADPPADQQTAQGRKIIAKIDKLLALAASDNEHEAALAMQRATELLQRHNLKRETLEHPSACSRLIINTRLKQMATYRRAICSILRDYFFVKVVLSSLYDPLNDVSHKTIELLGRAENVPVAEHCYYFLEQQLASLWQANRHKFKGNTRTAKNSYYLGLLNGFAQKMRAQQIATELSSLQQQEKSEQVTPGALAISRDTILQDFVDMHFPRLSRRASRGARIYRQTFDDAVATGKKIVLNKTVSEQKQGVQGQLPGR
jgi:hypothetical protein